MTDSKDQRLKAFDADGPHNSATTTKSSSRKSNKRRPRSFEGCFTCRKRHVKCDEGQPECCQCLRAGIKCGGYKKGIFFETHGTFANDGPIRFRRPLLSLDEQKAMSQWLTTSVSPTSLNQLLTRIDEETDLMTLRNDQSDIVDGPFAAFSLSTIPAQECQDLGQPFFEQTNLAEMSGMADILPSVEELEAHKTPYPLNSSTSNPLQEQNDGMFGGSMTLRPNSAHQTSDSADLISMSLSFITDDQRELVNQAIPLLKHYGTAVVSFMFPFRHDNTPWHRLFLPQIKDSLASFALREDLSAASLTTFYGTLSVSAFSLGSVSQSEVWIGAARAFHRQACQHARAVLEQAYIEPGVANYKEMLMALITMAQVSSFLGRKRQTEGFLLEAEKLVRLKGLAAKKSRKMRMLHHCYSYIRLFHETTFVGTAALESTHRQQVRQAVEWSGLTSVMKDNLSFRLLQWTDLLEAMAVLKTQIEGENDLHVALPGFFLDSMYPEIYGIPENFFLYLSQVIRLGNEKDLAEGVDDGGHSNGGKSLPGFMRQAKSLEKAIDQLCPLTSTAPTAKDPFVLPTLLDGMQRALSIYFYRRIYDVNSSLLQDKAAAVRDWLCMYERSNPDLLYGSFGLLWPAFIAACEADSVELQASFSQWYSIAGQRSGLPCFKETLREIESVWKEKREARAKTVTWLDVMRKHSNEYTT